MSKRSFDTLVWREVVWLRPLQTETVVDVLTHLASTSPRGPIIWEVRGSDGVVRYLIGVEKSRLHKIENVFRAHGNVHFERIYQKPRKETTGAAQIRTSKKLLSLNTDTSLAVLRAGLAALANTDKDEELIVQIILGGSYGPTPVSPVVQSPNANWLEVICGTAHKATSDELKSMREKSEQCGFQCVIRIGTSNRKNYLSPMYDLAAAFRILGSAAGVVVYTESENPQKLTDGTVPWHFPLRLSCEELTCFMLLPVGNDDLPGTAPLHPRCTMPPEWYKEPKYQSEDRSFAVAMNGQKLSISPEAALTHTIILGPTGSGKSVCMLNQILADVNAGRGVLVIDPKQDLINDVLERIPNSRKDDVVILDATSPSPVGFNPLACGKYADKELVADTILSVLKEMFSSTWGVRTSDLVSASLLSIVNVDGASLLWLPELLTNASFRAEITNKVTDEIALKPFWNRFEKMSDYERRQHIEPVLNKLRQFLMRPKLRTMLGQSHPKFDLSDLFIKNKIVLVPLNKGVIGGEAARLLGSLIVGITWALALGRANVPQEQRKMVSVYIDELQDYLSLPTDLSDALAQARGMGLAITMAHQYREQLPNQLKAGIDTNARNKIIFGLSGKDAKELAALGGNLDALDFVSLPRYHVYTKFQQDGKDTGWVQGVTLPKPGPLQSAAELQAISMQRYGVPAETVDAELANLFKSTTPLPEDEAKGFKPSSVNRKTTKSTKSKPAKDTDDEAQSFKSSSVNRRRKGADNV